MTTAAADIAAVSDERDQWHALLLAAERAAFRRGFIAGDKRGSERVHTELAADWHAIAEPASRGGAESFGKYELRRWGPGGPKHFADPRPGDLTPAEILERAGASWEPLGLVPPGMVQLGGPPVHHHPPCLPVCHSYEPGLYPAAEADRIVAAIREAVDERERKARMHRQKGTRAWERGKVVPMPERGAA